MARAFTSKAAKDYPDHGIAKGDTYYFWTVGFRGRKQMSKTQPRQSQLTGSPTLSAAYAAQENFQDAIESATTVDDLVTACDSAIDDADSVISDFDDSISNLEDAFSGGCPALEEKQEQRDAVEAWKDEIENAKSDIEGLDDNDYKIEDPADREDPEDEDEIDEDAKLEDARAFVTDLSFDL